MNASKLCIVKRTPIALAFCELCRLEFHSFKRSEDEAEDELKALFVSHICKPQGSSE